MSASHFSAAFCLAMTFARQSNNYDDYHESSLADPQISATARKVTLENPMTRQEVEDKFRGLAGITLPETRVEEIIDTIRNLSGLRCITGIAALLTR